MTALGEPLARLEGRDKVTGAARYAHEHHRDDVLHGWIVQSTVARGRVDAIDVDAALAVPGVVEVLTADNAPRLHEGDDAELMVLQSPDVAYRGQVVALVLAESPEVAREVASTMTVHYDEHPKDVAFSSRHPGLYAPEEANAGSATDSAQGDVEAALPRAEVTVDATYSTPALFNNPMEPHATVAQWVGDRLEVIESTQGASPAASTLATVFDVPVSQVRVRAEHVGGGFGSKGLPKPNVVLAAMAARVTGRPVTLAYTRQMMFALAGYRTPTVSHVRLGAAADGRLSVISHEAFSQTSRLGEFAEQTAEYTRHMYAAPHRLTTHRVTALDVPTPSWMRAPGECPGAYALESAMDELAVAAGLDPVELRVINEPAVDPETGRPFSSRNLVACLRRGAELFGWDGRDPRPAARRDGRWLVGTGMSSSSYPAMIAPSGARAVARPGGGFTVSVNATDIGTGARTVMTQVAADALGVPADQVELRIADSDLPTGPVAGGSSGTASWGWAVDDACRQLRARLDAGEPVPDAGLAVEVDTTDAVGARPTRPRFAYGAQFVEVRVDLDSGEVVVPRMVGVFAAGRILNPRTARSQLIGGMTMGLSMALHEQGHVDPVLGDYANHDLATYHVAAHADVPRIEVEWLDEDDDELGPTRNKGVGEIGIVGAAAAVANAVHHATGIRVRDLPIQPDSLVADLPDR
jgi:xanthine dehydrogenase YagR molybdenum-binding subunit